MKRLSLIILTLTLSIFCFCNTVFAVEVSAELSSPVISLADQTTLSVKILESESVSDPQLPPLDDFNIYTTGKTFSTSIVNGAMTSSVVYNYVLIPQKAGEFKIGPIKVNIKGKEYQTQPLTLTVKPASATNQEGARRNTQSDNISKDSEYMIDAEIDKDIVYEGEQFVYSFKAFQRRGSSFFNDPVYIPPSFSGFWHEQSQPRRYSRNYNRNNYIVSEINTYLFPVSPGEVTIEPTRVIVTPDAFSNFFNWDPFSSNRSRSRSAFNAAPETLYTKPMLITVLPLPSEGRPRSFKGSVGEYNMTSDFSGKDMTVDETAMITLKISGVGNIKTVAAPDLPEIEGLDIRPSGDSVAVREAGGRVTGHKIFEFSIIPEQEGVYKIPALKWSYFDPEEKKYKTHKTEEFTMNIKPGASGPSGDVLAGLMNVPGELKVRDILTAMPLKSELESDHQPIIMSAYFWIMPVAPLVILFGSLILRKRQEKLAGDIGYRRLKRAHSFARKRLGNARKLMDSGNYQDFYGEISKALFEYVADKFNRSASGLTEAEVRDILLGEGYPENVCDDFSDLIRKSDFGRFAPGQSEDDSMQGLLDEAEKWIVIAEQKGKHLR